MSFLGDALQSAAPPATAATTAPAPASDSALVFALKLFGTGAALVAIATYASHKIAERDARQDT
jgi:hypothetical protein